MLKRQKTLVWLTLVAVAELRSCCQACFFVHGESPIAQELRDGHNAWNYNFQGQNWAGFDRLHKPWVCTTGKEQTPVNLPYLPTTRNKTYLRKAYSRFNYGVFPSNGSNITVVNNGHTIQVEFHGKSFPTAQIKVPEDAQVLQDALKLGPTQKFKLVNATAFQLHWHSHSEHMINGLAYPLELHIVHIVRSDQLPGCTHENGYSMGGCLACLAVLYYLDDFSSNMSLETIWQHMPWYEKPQPGWSVRLPKGAALNLDDMLPSDRRYIAYKGSLSSPPCYEGVLWHVMTTPVPIFRDQYHAFQLAIGNWQCVHKGAEGGGKLDPATQLYAESGYNTTRFTKAWSKAHLEARPAASRRQIHNSSTAATGIQSSDDWSCVKVAHGNNFRYTQPLHGRTLTYYGY